MASVDELPAVGSRIRLNVETWNGPSEVTGVLLDPAIKGHVTVKLVNGYNATHSLSSIVAIEKIGVHGVKSSKLPTPFSNADLPLVHILHTGGTIASKVDYTTGAVAARFEPEELLASIPQLADVARIETKKLGNMWSDDIRPQHWNRMIEATKESFEEGAVGVVITHGTDTMHISSAALAFAFSGSGSKPAGRIALTGSQRSSDRGSTDGAENLVAAVYWAANGPKPSGILDSTVVVMHGSSDDGLVQVNSGVSVRKNHSSRRDAFVSINNPPLAKISSSNGEISLELEPDYKSIVEGENGRVVNPPILFDLSQKILQLIAGPHLCPDQIIHASKCGYSAVLFWGTGLGHLPIDDPGDAPENSAVKEAVSNYISNGGVAVMATQCISGPVHLDVYSKGRDQQELGVIGHGANFSPEIALVKLHHLLSRGMGSEEISDLWAKSLVGENNLNI